MVTALPVVSEHTFAPAKPNNRGVLRRVPGTSVLFSKETLHREGRLKHDGLVLYSCILGGASHLPLW
jgi:hypothetical protein